MLNTTLVVVHKLRILILAALLLPGVVSAQTFTHVHLRVSDTDGAAQWYQSLFGGEMRPGGMASARYDNGFIGTMLDESGPAPSSGSVIDHFGFSVDDVAAKVEQAKSMGAVVRSEPSDGFTAPTVAVIEDPWGTRVQLIDDPDYAGIHHVHLFTEDVEALRDWFLEVFGGEYEVAGDGGVHSVRYDGIWVNISQSEGSTAPSRGRSLDHFGFSVEDMDAFVETISATGYEPYEIRPANPTSTTLLMFFEGAAGIHFEIAQPGGVTR